MKKTVLTFFLVAGLGSAHTALAQAGLVNLIATGVRLGVSAARKPKAGVAAPIPVQPVAATPAAPVAHAPNRQQLVRQRTPADKLPTRGSAEILAFEAQLDRCHAALLADSTSIICPPAQLTALQQAAVRVARAQPSWDLQPYQRETAFDLAEDAHRQRAAPPSK